MKKNEQKPTYEELEKECKQLRQTIGGYITSNKNYQSQVVKLKGELKDTYKSLNDTTCMLRDASNSMNALNERYDSLKRQYDAQSNLFTKTQNELSDTIRCVETFNEFPWYKRIFKKIVTEQ